VTEKEKINTDVLIIGGGIAGPAKEPITQLAVLLGDGAVSFAPNLEMGQNYKFDRVESNPPQPAEI